MDCNNTDRPKSLAPPYENSHECFEEDVTKDCVKTVSKVLKGCKSLLPGAEGKAARKHEKIIDDFIEGGRDYKAKMKK
ncbi:hypothetical protein ACHAO9_002932 [Fusarium lateritium]